MPLQAVRARGAELAMGAAKRLFTSVRAHVAAQTVLAPEAVAARGTSKPACFCFCFCSCSCSHCSPSPGPSAHNTVDASRIRVCILIG